MASIANWGNFPTVDAHLIEFETRSKGLAVVKGLESCVVRGSGLSYGDASLGAEIISTTKFSRIISFNEQEGIIETECGVTLDAVLQVIVPKGWFLPVTPGTKFITVGGAVAGDVHGKNHHSEGSFCRYVTKLNLLLADGSEITCTRQQNSNLFNLVCGGLGHAALILSVVFTLKPIRTSFIRQENVIIKNLDEMLAKLQDFNSSTYSVSWIDCLATGKSLGRGVLMLGEHALPDEVKGTELLKIHAAPSLIAPFFFPGFLLNSLSVSSFNFAYYNKFRLGAKQVVVHYDPYFYPLDFVRDWNKLYGRRGFLQYQFVIPFHHAAEGLRLILTKISKSGLASFLAVLKSLGPAEHLLSFPMPGYTLALDFPVSERIFPLLDELDKIVVEYGGRIYLVKDARMKPEIFQKGYPAASKFREQVLQYDPNRKFSSSLSKRLQVI